MEGGALFNPGFIGGSFIWWIGQIADNSSWRNNELPGKFEGADSIKGFGKRYKVRIIGVHDKEEETIPSDQLPWANIMYPITAGGGQGGSYQTANLRQGMFVFGFYMDGQDMQVPVIMGVLGNNALTGLQTKIGNSDSNFAGTSGYAQGQEDIKGPAQSLPMDEGKTTLKPKDADTSKEESILSGNDKTNDQGLPLDKQATKEQQADLESAKADIESMSDTVKEKIFGNINPTTAEKNDYIKGLVTQGMKKRVDFANSPGSPAKPGATLEGTGSLMQLAAADIKLEDKYREKTVLVVPDKVVESATKAIQTIGDNLTQKIEKNLSAMGNYSDAVSGPPQDLDKLVKDSACQMSKYMKVIMDKIMEYGNKKLNEELTETVSAMPSCMRSEVGDMMNMMGENTLKKYNGITDKICGNIESVLAGALNLKGKDGLIEKQKKQVAENVGLTTVQSYKNPVTGSIVERIVPVETKRTHPNVPMCSAESIIGNVISEVKDVIADVNNTNINGVSRYVDDVTAQLERMDAEFKERSEDATKDGGVLTITDEEVLDEVRGGTKYKTMVQVGTQWSSSTDPTRAGLSTSEVDGQGLLVDINVPTGGLGGTGSGSIDFTWVNQGTGYTNQNAISCNGGSGTGMKVNLVTSAGSITNIFTHTTGTGYKEGEELTIQSGNFDAKFTLDAVWGKIQDGGIRVNKRGVGYVIGDVYTVLNGSGDATFMIIAVVDKGDVNLDSDSESGSSSSKPQSLGDMIPKLSGLTGNLTSALNFENITGNIFPFELPPNPSPVDFVTLASGGESQPDSQMPNMSSIRKTVAEKVKTGIPSKEVPFLTPKAKKVIDLVEKKVK